MQSQSDAAAQFRAQVKAKIAEPTAAEPTVNGVASDTTPSSESSTTAVDSQKPSSDSPPAATITTTAQTTSNKVCNNKKNRRSVSFPSRNNQHSRLLVCVYCTKLNGNNDDISDLIF